MACRGLVVTIFCRGFINIYIAPSLGWYHGYRDRINLYQLDAREFCTNVIPSTDNGFVFFDPPYIDISRKLYLNAYSIEDHNELSDAILKTDVPWIVTYDEAAIREKLFSGCRSAKYLLNYTAQKKYTGTEVMFVSDNLRFPKAKDLFGEKISVVRANLQKLMAV